MKYLVWHVQGGLGKNVAATALTRSIKENYPDRYFILVCSWPEVFLQNPHIDRVYQLGQTPYFYKDYIHNKDVLIFRHEPYNQTGHITRKNHLIESWCELLNIPFTHQHPILYPNYVHKKITQTWRRSKPIMVLQTGGGLRDAENQLYNWTRDMPIEIAEALVEKYRKDYHIIQITRSSGYQLNNVECINSILSNMELFALLWSSEKRVLIDSCLQHAAAAMNLPSAVLWIGTTPDNFGYSLHSNLIANLDSSTNELIGSYLFDYQFDNNIHECPFTDVSQLFDMNQLFSKVEAI